MDLTAGFVLTGGKSRRMGRDETAARNVTLIGAPDRYRELGWPVAADLVEDCGPVGGLYTALETTRADWNLLLACDMPGLTEAFLRELIAAAQTSGALCTVPESQAGLHPLCAVYHRGARVAATAAIVHKRFKMHDLLKDLGAVAWPVSDAALVQNVNTPQEWSAR